MNYVIGVDREPELLTHPNIPKPMHGVNPRTAMGQKWWDDSRRRVYAEKNFRCFACGVHKTEADYHRWLECHEDYDIDYANGKMVLKRLVALCPACHGFIHSGRLYALATKGETHRRKALYILGRGLAILREAGLKPFPGTVLVHALLTGADLSEAEEMAEALGSDWPVGPIAPWAWWRLVIDGKEYPPKFASMAEWSEHYGAAGRPPRRPHRVPQGGRS